MFRSLLIAVFVLISIEGFNQSTTGKVSFKRKSTPALVLELPNIANDIEGTIVSKLKESGYKPQTEGNLFWKKNTQDGFYVFKGISLSSLGSRPLDLYFKVIEDKRNADTTSLALLISTGNEAFISPEDDMQLWSDARSFLDGFVNHSSSFQFEREVKGQNTRIKNLQSKLALLQRDQKELEEKILKYQRELEVNKSRQVETAAEVRIQTNMLERTKAKNAGSVVTQ